MPLSVQRAEVLLAALSEEREARLAAEARAADAESRVAETTAHVQLQIDDLTVQCRRAGGELRQLKSTHAFAAVFDRYEGEIGTCHEELMLLRSRNVALEAALADAVAGPGHFTSATPPPATDAAQDQSFLALLQDLQSAPADADADGDGAGNADTDAQRSADWQARMARVRRERTLLKRRIVEQDAELQELKQEVLSLRAATCRVSLYKRCLEDAGRKLQAAAKASLRAQHNHGEAQALRERVATLQHQSAELARALELVQQERDGLRGEMDGLRRHLAQVHEEQRKGVLLATVQNRVAQVEEEAATAAAAAPPPEAAVTAAHRLRAEGVEDEADAVLTAMHKEVTVRFPRLLPSVVHLRRLVADMAQDRAASIQREADLIDTLSMLVSKRNDPADVVEVRKLTKALGLTGVL